MKIFVQYWTPFTGKELVSLSKDREQLQRTVARVAPPYSLPSRADEMVPRGEPVEIEVPDDSAFAPALQRNTVFLQEDEMSVVRDNTPQ